MTTTPTFIELGKKSRPEWPDGFLDFDVLSSTGWTPSPIHQFVFKPYMLCNLSCSYCYVYEMADESWKTKPRRMSLDVLQKSAERIGEHAEKHKLEKVYISIHGGEPLLSGKNFLIELVERISREVKPAPTSFSMQTNGALIDEEMADLLLKLNIKVRISLDGDRVANDRHRLVRNGKSTYDDVVKAISVLSQPRYREIFEAIMCVIDLKNDPVQTYEHLVGFKPPSLQFILPFGNWDNRPPNKLGDEVDKALYADWLIKIFDAWFDASEQTTHIITFSEIINILLGGRSKSEALGLSPTRLAFIESDGTIEQVDTLKTAYDGAPETGLNVFDNSFDDALRLPSFMARQIGGDALCNECRECSVASVCGGGMYSNRYATGTGFLNRSVYCSDLYTLVMHVYQKLQQSLPVEMQVQAS